MEDKTLLQQIEEINAKIELFDKDVQIGMELVSSKIAAIKDLKKKVKALTKLSEKAKKITG